MKAFFSKISTSKATSGAVIVEMPLRLPLMRTEAFRY